MKRVSTVEIIHNFSVHGDAALVQPVIVTKGGRDRLVLMSVEKYEDLRRTASRAGSSGPNQGAMGARRGLKVPR